jgi:hypothetical protein
MQREVILSTSTRKKIYKSSFKYSNMKQLENAREYKKLLRRDIKDQSNITKASKLSTSLLKDVQNNFGI